MVIKVVWYNMTEPELCKKIGCSKTTLRAYLDGYKFEHIRETRKRTKYYATPEAKRKSVMIHYKLNNLDIAELKELRQRHTIRRYYGNR